jgi:hypothetical protein
MGKSAALFLLLFALSSAAPADVIYQFTGLPFDSFSGNWTQVFGSDPTNITATVDVANPFPLTGGSVGTPGSPTFGFGPPPGIISASISDGLRTFTPDEVFLSGSGTTIQQWVVGGGVLISPIGSGQRAIFTEQMSSPPGAAANSSEFNKWLDQVYWNSMRRVRPAEPGRRL